MRDMNFFRPYVKEKPKADPRRLLLVVLAILLAAGLGYLTVDMILRQQELRSEIALLEDELTSPVNREAVRRVDEKNAQLKSIEELEQILIENQREFDLMNVVSDDFMNLLNAQIPDGALLKTLEITETTLLMTGSAIDHTAVSQFVYNLRQTGRLFDLNITTVQNVEANYDFTISAKIFVGVKADESQ